jgi:hypothetical protein
MSQMDTRHRAVVSDPAFFHPISTARPVGDTYILLRLALYCN